jgi:hypothetical protein
MATKRIRPSLVTSSSSSLVTACKVGAGSTTAASKASHRPGEEYQGKQHTHFQHCTSASTSQSCTIYQELNKFLQIITQTHPAKHYGGQVKLKAKLGEEEPADHLRRRRTSWSQEQARRWRTSRSQARRSRPARSKSASTASVHSITFAQL